MRTVIFLGLVSFFADVSADMVYPIIPLYLTAAFGATPALVGIIEGVAESLASLLKVFSGYITDRYRRKKPLALFGYGTGLIYKFALLGAASWGGVLFARLIDRLGKGIRTAPRDVMVSESTDPAHMGRAFGIHKALDMAGSAVGILVSYFLLRSLSGDTSYQTIFWWSMVPAVLSVAMFLFVHEKKEPRVVKEREPFWKNTRALDGRLKLYLVVTGIFTLGNSSNTFLLLRAKNVGFDDTNVLLLYFLYNLLSAFLAIPLGRLSDRVGRKRILVAGYVVFSVVYLGFAYAGSAGAIVFVFALYSLYTALLTGVERAFIAEIAPTDLKGTMLGLHSTIVGVALLPASTIAGLLWDRLGPQAPFLYGAALSLAAALLLGIFLKKPEPAQA